MLQKRQRAQIKSEDVAKERAVLISIGTKQHGRQKAADERHYGNRRGVIEQGQRGGACNQNYQPDKSHLLWDQMVITEGRVRRQIERSDAPPCKNLRECPPPSPMIAIAEREHRDAGDDANRHAAKFANPAIIERVLEKKRGGKQNQRHRRPT